MVRVGDLVRRPHRSAGAREDLDRKQPRPSVNKPIAELDLTSRARPIVVALGVTDAAALYNVTEKQIAEIEKQYSSRIWSEVCRVLEGLGYDMSGRR